MNGTPGLDLPAIGGHWCQAEGSEVFRWPAKRDGTSRTSSRPRRRRCWRTVAGRWRRCRRSSALSNLFLACEPLAGWRHVAASRPSPPHGPAGFVRELLDGCYRETERVVLIMDQLNTHSLASLCKAFAPAGAKHLAERIEPHHTPKHASWLNMAAIELSALGRNAWPDALPITAQRASPADCSVGGTAQRRAGQSQLALHHRSGPQQAPQRLPIMAWLTKHQVAIAIPSHRVTMSAANLSSSATFGTRAARRPLPRREQR